MFSAYSWENSSDTFAFFCDSLLSLETEGTMELTFFLLTDVDLPRPAPPVAPPAMCVVMTGVTASIAGPEDGVAKIGAEEDDDVAAVTPDVVVAAAVDAEGDAPAGVVTTFAKDFFLSSAKAAEAAAADAAAAIAPDLEASSADAAASAAAFAAAASAFSQAAAAAMTSECSSKFG